MFRIFKMTNQTKFKKKMPGSWLPSRNEVPEVLSLLASSRRPGFEEGTAHVVSRHWPC